MHYKLNRTWVTRLFFAAVIVCFAIYLQGLDWAALGTIRVHWEYLALALPVSLGIRFCYPLIWILLIHELGGKTNAYRALICVYAKAWLGRYIPGKVVWILGKVYFASQHGISKRVLGVSTLVEAGIQMATGLIVAFVFLLWSDQLLVLEPGLILLTVLCLAGILVSLWPPVFNFLMQLVHRWAGKGDLESRYHLRLAPLLKIGLAYMGIHLVSVLPYFLLAKAIQPDLAFDLLPYLGASYLLAGVLGTLAVFAPSGIGVREGVQLILLAPVLPAAVLVVLVVLARVWSAALDLVFFGISRRWDTAQPNSLAEDG